MKKPAFLIVLLLSSFLLNAQPIPDCAESSVSKRLFLKGNEELLCDLEWSGAKPSSINGCRAISTYRIKDSLSSNYFIMNVYKNIKDFSDDIWKREKVDKMQVYFVNNVNEKSFNYFLEIPEFKKGIYFIDVSKGNKVKKMNCQMCRDSIDAIDITPQNWTENETFDFSYFKDKQNPDGRITFTLKDDCNKKILFDEIKYTNSNGLVIYDKSRVYAIRIEGKKRDNSRSITNLKINNVSGISYLELDVGWNSKVVFECSKKNGGKDEIMNVFFENLNGIPVKADLKFKKGKFIVNVMQLSEKNKKLMKKGNFLFINKKNLQQVN
jgi:hypothetical protein